MSQYGGRPLISDLETKYQSNMDVTSEMESLSQIQEPSIITKENRRKFRNAKGDISNFFNNLTKTTKHKRAKSGENAKNIPFQLLMGNFRRKKILDTLKNKQITYDEKNNILQPYEEYIDRVLNEFQDQD